MHRLLSFLIATAIFAHSGSPAIGEDKKTVHYMQSLEGTYDRIGEIDHAVEAQFKDSKLVLIPPAFIDEILVFPKLGTRDDANFIVQKRGNAEFLLVLPKARLACALADLGSVVELLDGSLLVRRTVTIGGEGSRDHHVNREDRISKEQRNETEWLVVETRIEWMERSWFEKKKVEFRSLVRFRKE